MSPVLKHFVACVKYVNQHSLSFYLIFICGPDILAVLWLLVTLASSSSLLVVVLARLLLVVLY